jgi:hypothetical protein
MSRCSLRWLLLLPSTGALLPPSASAAPPARLHCMAGAAPAAAAATATGKLLLSVLPRLSEFSLP